MNSSFASIALLIIIGWIVLSVVTSPEKFTGTTSTGALIDLYSKGPQDRYLMTLNHRNPYYYNYRYRLPYPEMIWNNPTRVRNYWAPGVPWYHYPFRFLFY